MHLLYDKGSHRAIRYTALVMALAGLAIMIGGYAINPYLVQRDQVIFETLSPDDPNWMYYKDLGDAPLVFGYSLRIGIGLLIVSLVTAVLYYLIGRGITFKLKGSNVE